MVQSGLKGGEWPSCHLPHKSAPCRQHLLRQATLLLKPSPSRPPAHLPTHPPAANKTAATAPAIPPAMAPALDEEPLLVWCST